MPRKLGTLILIALAVSAIAVSSWAGAKYSLFGAFGGAWMLYGLVTITGLWFWPHQFGELMMEHPGQKYTLAAILFAVGGVMGGNFTTVGACSGSAGVIGLLIVADTLNSVDRRSS